MIEISKLLAAGESSRLEFKSEQIRPDDLAKEIVAFLNFEGGRVLIGVEDDGTVSGISRTDAEEWVVNICRNNVVPAILPVIEKYPHDDKIILVLEIPKGVAKPYHTQKGDYYIRVGSTARKASREELFRLFQDSGMVHDEVSPIPNTSVRDLEPTALHDYFLNLHPARLNIDEELPDARDRLLRNLDLIADNGCLTIVGMLLFGREPQRFLPQSEVLFANFAGRDVTDDFIDRKSIIGNLPRVVDDAQRIVELSLPVPSKIEGLKREDPVVFPVKVIREVLVNALIHRRWSLMGNVRVFLFEDRLQVSSPGKLPNGVTVEKMKQSTHVPRNSILMKFMQDYHYVEKVGRGVPMIVREMKRLSRRDPEFVESGEEFFVTLYKA